MAAGIVGGRPETVYNARRGPWEDSVPIIRAGFAAFIVLSFAFAPLLVAADKKKEDASKGEKGKRPALDLRALPRFAFSPASIHFTAELMSGDDVEEFYCPDVEWEWGDGGKSQQESDCSPFEPGTKIDRHFTADHVYQLAGRYGVKVTLSKAGKTVATQSLQLTVRPGVGDRTNSPEDQ
jgi:hypothetical protein